MAVAFAASSLAEMTQHKYKAFLSYAHADARIAAWLHKNIEGYRLPRSLRRRFGKEALKPVCRDRDDLRSGSDLGAVITEALKKSEALIVVCSEAAAASPWVNQEIRVFKAQHGVERIFSIITQGEPPSCFPEALTEDGAEPIAADARPQQDGRRDALLKTIAGLLNVDFDVLKQRDLRRRHQRMSWIATGSLALAVVMTGLALVAINAREEAELRRAQAEDLIGFMLGDLRTRLEPIGRLDVLDAVGDKAVDYFAALDDTDLDAPTQLAHAQALRQIGEVRVYQGNLDSAREAFEASNARARQVVDADDSEVALFELSQSYFWVGYSYYAQNKLDAAAERFGQYLEVAQALSARSPENADYQVEIGYAHSNLGTVAVERRQYQEGETHFKVSEKIARGLLAADPDSQQLKRDLAETLSWLSRTATHTQIPQVAVERYAEEFALRQDIAREGGFDDRLALANTGTMLSRRMVLARQFEAAEQVLDEALTHSQALVAHDDANAEWRKVHVSVLMNKAVVDAIYGRAEALPRTQSGVKEYRALMELDATNSRRQLTLIAGLAQQARLLRLANEQDRFHQTLDELITLIEAYAPKGSEDERVILAGSYLLAGDALEDEAYWARGWDQLAETRNTLNPPVLLTRQLLAQRLGNLGVVAEMGRRLEKIKFRDTQNGAIVGILVSGSFLTTLAK